MEKCKKSFSCFEISHTNFISSELVLLLQNVPGSTDKLGVVVLKSRAIFSDAHWYWIGVGAVLGYVVFFNLMATLALTYLKRMCYLSDLSCNYFHLSSSKILLKSSILYAAFGKSGAVLPDETVAQRKTKIRNIDINSSTGGTSCLYDSILLVNI